MMPDYDDAMIERFLLDGVSIPEREEIEQRLFDDDELFARIEDLENDLVDSFVRGELSPALRDRFQRSLEGNPARQKKVAFGRLLDTKLSTVHSSQLGIVPFVKRHRTVWSLGLAAALLVLMFGAPALFRSTAPAPEAETSPVVVASDSDESAPPSAPEVAPETATDSANTTIAPMAPIERPTTIAIKKPPVPMLEATKSVTFVLSTLTLRSGTGPATLEIRDDVDVVIIQLALESDEFPSYNVDIRGSSGISVWSETRLPLTTIDESPALSFDVPVAALEPGRHELVLAGVDESGAEEIAYIDFEVSRARL